MDVKTLTNAQLLVQAFGISGQKAEEATKWFFPEYGEHFVMEASSGYDKLSEQLKAAVEIDRRMAGAKLSLCSSPQSAKSLIQKIIGPQHYESFWVVFLDSQNRVITSREMNKGTLNSCSVYPRQIAKAALDNNAAAVFLAHNHPSGEARPSRSDETLTQTIKASLALIDVQVLDHFIMTRTTIVSMAEMGLV